MCVYVCVCVCVCQERDSLLRKVDGLRLSSERLTEQLEQERGRTSLAEEGRERVQGQLQQQLQLREIELQ